MADTYTTYKDSGVDWIGEIPEHWNTQCLRTLGWTQNGISQGGEYFNEDFEFPFVSYSETYKNYVVPYPNGRANSSEYDRKTYSLIEGDILFTRTSETIEEIGFASTCINTIPNAVYSGFLIRFRPTSPLLYKGFSKYYFRGQMLRAYFVKQMNIVTRASLSQDLLKSLTVILPPITEQKSIANFLDEKCSEIDDLISLQEKMIDELKAYKQSVITEAVTKGLDRNVKMKDSGVDWIGEIPEHWKLRPIKYLFNRRSHKNNPVETTERLSLSIDKGVTLYSEKTTNLDRFKEDYTQYQLAHPNDIVLNCMNMIVGAIGLSQYFGCVSPVYYVIYASNEETNPLYFSFALNTPTIRSVYYSMGKGIYAIERGEGRVNTCRLKVSYDDFGRLEIPEPPYQEQNEITTFIETKCSEIDSLISIKEKKIEELKDYKKSLIYEYVTGKKRVV